MRNEPDVNLELPSVSKHNWKALEHRDHWDNLLGKFPQAFDRAVEAALADEEHPRTALVRTLEIDDALALLARQPDGIEVARRDEGEETTVALVGPDCSFDAEVLLEAGVDPVDLQLASGVPECCAGQYDAFREEGFTDPIAGIARNTASTAERAGELVVEDPHPILNLAWSYRGWRFVDFYPCSFECDHARDVAVANGRFLREEGNDRIAEATFDFLAAPTYWSGYHGLAHVKNRWAIGEYTTDDYWREEIVRFNGYHQALAEGSNDERSE